MNKPPVANNNKPVIEMVVEDLNSRYKKGLETYSVPLQAFNKRNSPIDAYEELLDQVCYFRQWIEERNKLVAFCREVEAETQDKWLADRAFSLLNQLGELDES